MKMFSRVVPLAVVAFGLFFPNLSDAFIRDPWIQDVTQTSVTITWEAATTGGTQELHWGTDADALDTVVTGQLVDGQLYRATVDNLEISSGGFYEVVSGAEVSPAGTFVTATCNTEPFVFVATGDNRDGVTTHQAVVDAILQHGGSPDFSINTGDIVDGTDYLEFFNVEKTLLKDIPIFPAPGNHDDTAEYQYGFDREMYYAFDYGNTRFIALNTNGLYFEGTPQGDFITTELVDAHARRSAGEIDWIVVYHHHPTYSSGSHGNTFAVNFFLTPLYESYDVDVVVSGHDHNYERSEVNGITHLVTGGGGVNTRPVSCDANNGCVYAESIHHFTQFVVDGQEMTIRAIDTAGNVIDSTVLDKGDPASGEPCNPIEEPPPDDPPPDDPPPDDPGGNPPGAEPTPELGGCSCRVAPEPDRRALGYAMLLVAMLGLLLVRRRRRLDEQLPG